ncbi:hypothetical protein TNCV_4159381 [Trichonephila clavipes]|nr:hypothetical protein TNCV_4159381 [Trichonephila clavipes]
MDFTEINSRRKRGELFGRINRQNSRFRNAKTIIIKLGLHASFVELESAKDAVNEENSSRSSKDRLPGAAVPSTLFSGLALNQITQQTPS